jgi:hypothetical protein
LLNTLEHEHQRVFIVFGISDTADGLSLHLLDFGPVDHDLDQ